MKQPRLKFAKGNAKLGKETAILSLPAGWTCNGAKDCLSRANRLTGKLTDGKDVKFRCYAASSENLFANVRKGRWNNFELLRGKTIPQMTELISRSLPRKIKLCRIHASGDFFSQDYFDAWIEVAKQFPAIVFYAYTKALPYWVNRLNEIPNNLRLVASLGGRFDEMVKVYNLRRVEVVFSVQAAKDDKLPIDHDDSLAWKTKGNFALLLHGTQPAGSEAGKQLYKLRHSGAKVTGGYKADYFAHYDKSGKTSANRLNKSETVAVTA